MILSKEKLIDIAKEVNCNERKMQREEDYKKWLFFSGRTKSIILEALKKEFKKPETVNDLASRIVPLNIMKKIIDKLSGIYTESPLRTVSDKNEKDIELVELFETTMNLDSKKKEGNRYFKLFKRNLEEIYVDQKGFPQIRNLPKHTYEVLSYSDVSPEIPEVVVKILKDAVLEKDQILCIYSDESIFITDGEGAVLTDRMAKMSNPDGVNPLKTLPFVYTNESSNLIDPIQDDDLFNVSIAIPIVLTDLLFACKYQAWSIIYSIGTVGDIPVNPNSVMTLQYDEQGNKPEIGTIQPNVDSDKIILLITNILSMLLSSKNLSVNTVQSSLGVQDVISGVSKMLDNAESIEDKKDQQAFFYRSETEFWYKLSKILVPYWRANNKLNEKINYEFSPAFEIDILFREPKAMISETETVDLSIKKIDNKLSTRKNELRRLYPDYDLEQIEELMEEIEEESMEQVEEINEESSNDAKETKKEPLEDQDGVQSTVQD